jgi:hypothetical protein
VSIFPLKYNAKGKGKFALCLSNEASARNYVYSFYLLVGYTTKPSVGRMDGWQMKDYLGRIWKEAVVA